LRRTLISQVLSGLTLLLALLSGPGWLFAEGIDPKFRQELLDAYDNTVKDPQYDALVERLRTNAQDSSVVDQYLTFLPISPLEMLKIDMEVKHYEIAIPKIIHQYHERWK